MVKLYASILAVVLTTSLTLAVPLAIVSDELEARDPNIFGDLISLGTLVVPGGAEARAGIKVFEYGNKARKALSKANKARKAIKRMKDVHDAVSSNNNNNKNNKKDKHHRRDLGGIDEELLGREYDILDERDYLD